MASETGYAVETTLEKAEIIARNKKGNSQWRLHTTDGLYITKPDMIQAKSLTTRSSGPVILEISNNRIIGLTWIVERKVAPSS